MPAAIFNTTTDGAAVKLLKNILRFKGGKQLVSGFTEAEIIAGIPSPQWSHAIPIDSKETYIKYGVLDTEWKTLSDFIVEDLGAIASDPHGFVSPEGKIDYDYDDATRTLTLTPTGDDYTYYNNGVKNVIDSAKSKQITDTEGLWFWFYDNTGALDASQNENDIFEPTNVFAGSARWNATNKLFIHTAYEYHSTKWPKSLWKYVHQRFGTAFVSGFSPGNIDSNGTGNDDSNAQISVDNGVIADEDIELSIEDGSPQEMSPILQAPIFYLLGSDWRKIDATNFICTTTGTGRGAYNLDTGGVWSLAEVQNNFFFCMHVFATNDINHPMVLILGQEQYATGPAANAGAQVELSNLQLGGLPTVEWSPIATFVLQTADSYTNSVKSRVREDASGNQFVDWRASNITPTASPSNHNTLLNLTSGDVHTQYLNVDGRDSNLVIYLGNKDTDGSWRLRTDQAGKFWIEERVSGVWQERTTLP